MDVDAKTTAAQVTHRWLTRQRLPLFRDDGPAMSFTRSGRQWNVEVLVVDLGWLRRADAGAVDTLSRLQLAAKRGGRELRLRHAGDELLELIDFMGLGEVLRVEPSRQPEQREQRLGVEEERELDDPSS